MKSPFSVIMITVSALLFQGQFAAAQDALLDPGLHGKFHALYRTKKPGGGSGHLSLFVERKSIEGTDVYHMRFLESENIETNVILAAADLQPVFVGRKDKDERIYTVRYEEDYADVFIPKDKVEESQKAIPFIFRKLFAVLSKKTTVEVEGPQDASPSEEEEIETRLPSKFFAGRMLAYQEKSGMLPSPDSDTRRRFLLPPRTLTVHSLPFVLAGFPFGRKKQIDFPLAYMPHPMVIWQMKATHEGEEEILVPAGKIVCHKIRLQTAEWFSRFAFGDKTYFWIRKDPPHILVKHTHPFAKESSELIQYQKWDAGD
jgi:hypothetical protein